MLQRNSGLAYPNLNIDVSVLPTEPIIADPPKYAVYPDPQLYGEEAARLMRKRGIITEEQSAQHALERTVNALIEIDETLNGGPDEEFARGVVDFTERGIFVFGTPVLTNAGRKNNITAACTVLPVSTNDGEIDMNMFREMSHKALSDSLGTGYDLSTLNHPAEAIIELNGILDDINSHLLSKNKRPVASMATLRADHPDVLEFIRVKRNADFSKWRFNISLFVTEELFEKASRGEDWLLLDSSGDAVDSIPAHDLLLEIARNAHYCGEPGILFKDRIDADNPTPQWEYKSTAPCAEVAMSEGEACQFSYINLAALVKPDNTFDTDSFKMAVRMMTRLLDASVEHTIRESGYDEYPLVTQKRRIGIGITGFADLLVRLKIPYDSQDAVMFAAQISESLDFYSKDASAELAITRGPFPAFQNSNYLNHSWLERKLPRSQGGVVPEDWHRLFGRIVDTGIRHASTTSMPPTGTSSAIISSSKSLEPLFSLLDDRGAPLTVVMESLSKKEREQVIGELHVGKGILGNDTLQKLPFLRTARQLSPASHLQVQGAFQGFLDESLAKTINLPNQASPEDVLDILISAWRSQLKGITVFRDGCLDER